MRKSLQRLVMVMSEVVVLAGTAQCKKGGDSGSPVVVSHDSTVVLPVAKVRTYLALGDSYTIGQSIDSVGRYPAQVAGIVSGTNISIPAIRYIATTGWTTGDLQHAIALDNPADTFDLVTLLIGVNDQYQGVDTGTYKTRFTQLLQTSVTLARNDKKRVIVISIPDYGVSPFGHNTASISTQIDQFNAINKRITDSFAIAYVDVTTLSRAAEGDNTYFASDGLHYSLKEYKLWAENLAPFMDSVLK